MSKHEVQCPACDGDGTRINYVDGVPTEDTCGRCNGSGQIQLVQVGQDDGEIAGNKVDVGLYSERSGYHSGNVRLGTAETANNKQSLVVFPEPGPVEGTPILHNAVLGTYASLYVKPVTVLVPGNLHPCFGVLEQPAYEVVYEFRDGNNRSCGRVGVRDTEKEANELLELVRLDIGDRAKGTQDLIKELADLREQVGRLDGQLDAVCHTHRVTDQANKHLGRMVRERDEEIRELKARVNLLGREFRVLYDAALGYTMAPELQEQLLGIAKTGLMIAGKREKWDDNTAEQAPQKLETAADVFKREGRHG